MENDVFERLRNLLKSNPKLDDLLFDVKEGIKQKPYNRKDSLEDISDLFKEYLSKPKKKSIDSNHLTDDSNSKKNFDFTDLVDFYFWLLDQQDFALIKELGRLLGELEKVVKGIDSGRNNLAEIKEITDEAIDKQEIEVQKQYNRKMLKAEETYQELKTKLDGLTQELNEAEAEERNRIKNLISKLEEDERERVKKEIDQFEKEQKAEKDKEITKYLTDGKAKKDTEIAKYLEDGKAEKDKEIAKYLTDGKAEKDKEIAKYKIAKTLEADNEVAQAKQDALALIKQEAQQERLRLQVELIQPVLQQLKEITTQNKLAEKTLTDTLKTITDKEKEIDTYNVNIKQLNDDISQTEEKKNSVLTQLTTSEQFFSMMGAMVTLPDTLIKISDEVTHASEENKKDLEEIKSTVTQISSDSEETAFSIKATVMESALHVVDQTSEAINSVSTSLESYRSVLTDELKAILEGLPKLNEIVQPEVDKLNEFISSLEGYTGDFSHALTHLTEMTDNLVKNATKYDIDKHALREYRRRRAIDNEEKSNNRNTIALLTRELTLCRGIIASTVSQAFKLDDAIKHYPLTREGFINYFTQLGMISANDLEEMFYKANGQASPLMQAIRLRTRFNSDYTKMIVEYFAPHFPVTVIMPDADNYKLLEKYDIKTIFSEIRYELKPGEDFVSTSPILGNIHRATFDYELIGRLDPDRFEELRDDIFSTEPLLVESMMDEVMTNDNILISEKASVLAKGATEIPFYTASLMGVLMDSSIDESRNPMDFPDPDIINEGVHLTNLVDSSYLPEDYFSLLHKYPFIDAKYMFDTASLKDYYDDLEVGIYTITLPAYFKEKQSVERISFGFYHDGIVPFMTGVYNAMKELAEEQSERVADEDNSYKPFSENGIPLPASLEYFKGGQLSDTD